MDIFVSLPAQTLELFADDGTLLRRYSISTATKGAGEQSGSFMTPRGKHLIRAKVGAGCEENTVFVRRRPTGEVWSSELAEQFPGRDWILSRILWLSGRQPGFNRLGQVDTMRRYIYLHGSPDTAEMGEPGSIGCVRMRNRDIIELFDLVPPYTPVNIGEYRIVSGESGESGEAANDDAIVQARAFDPSGNTVGQVRLSSGGWVDGLTVESEWRGREVASNLMRRLLEVAGSAGLPALTLETPVFVAPLFSRLGFEAADSLIIEDAAPRIRMRRDLTA